MEQERPDEKKYCLSRYSAPFLARKSGISRIISGIEALSRFSKVLRGLKRSDKAFNLAELLIALAILGVIATFTIPKVLQSQQNGKFKSIGKEAAGAISQAYAAYRLNNTPTANTLTRDLTPFFNYVRYDTTGQIDSSPTATTLACDANNPCLRMHNGAVLRFYDDSFGGTGSTNAIRFHLDPDGKADGVVKSVPLFLYFNGRLRTRGEIEPATCTNLVCQNPDPARVPSWFGWD